MHYFFPEIYQHTTVCLTANFKIPGLLWFKKQETKQGRGITAYKVWISA